MGVMAFASRSASRMIGKESTILKSSCTITSMPPCVRGPEGGGTVVPAIEHTL
jgi:hypothetical protein